MMQIEDADRIICESFEISGLKGDLRSNYAAHWNSQYSKQFTIDLLR